MTHQQRIQAALDAREAECWRMFGVDVEYITAPVLHD